MRAACSSIVIGALALAACGGQAPASEDTASAPAPGSMFTPSVTLNQVMVDVINEHAHTVWDIDNPGGEPATDEAWAQLRHAGVTLAMAGSVTVLGGSGANDREWVERPDWQLMSQAMTDAGVQALVAAERRNVEALRAAGNALVSSCIQCHRAYRLGIPNIWAEQEMKVPGR